MIGKANLPLAVSTSIRTMFLSVVSFQMLEKLSRDLRPIPPPRLGLYQPALWKTLYPVIETSMADVAQVRCLSFELLATWVGSDVLQSVTGTAQTIGTCLRVKTGVLEAEGLKIRQNDQMLLV